MLSSVFSDTAVLLVERFVQEVCDAARYKWLRGEWNVDYIIELKKEKPETNFSTGKKKRAAKPHLSRGAVHSNASERAPTNATLVTHTYYLTHTNRFNINNL